MLNSKKEKGLFFFFLVTTSSGCLFSWPLLWVTQTFIYILNRCSSYPSSHSLIFPLLSNPCCQYSCVSGGFSTPHLLNCHLDIFLEACAFQSTKNFQHWVANSFITFYYNYSWVGWYSHSLCYDYCHQNMPISIKFKSLHSNIARLLWLNQYSWLVMGERNCLSFRR